MQGCASVLHTSLCWRQVPCTALPLTACGGTWLCLQPRWCLVPPSPASPLRSYQSKFLAVRGFSSLRLLEGSSPTYAGLQSVLVGEYLHLASSRTCFQPLGFALSGFPKFLFNFFACRCGAYAVSKYFSWDCFSPLTLFSMAGCPCCVFDL